MIKYLNKSYFAIEFIIDSCIYIYNIILNNSQNIEKSIMYHAKYVFITKMFKGLGVCQFNVKTFYR